MPLWTADASQVEAMVVLEAVLCLWSDNAAEGPRCVAEAEGEQKRSIFDVEVSKIVCS